MSLINYSQREISCKIVYYGCGLCGKTTNLKYLYSRIAAASRGQLISLATELDRTLFFDFMPLDLGTISGFKTRFHLYTVPGQVFYNASRKLVLKGVDGVIFVVDSQVERMDANIESLANLEINLRDHNLRLEEMPFVIQHNKRDLPNIMSVSDLDARMNPRGVPYFEAVASQGIGVFDTLKSVSKMVLTNLARM
jgi:signal recognition particle receptor subunit beta